MSFAIDHDYHIHSQLSLCSNDPLQNTEAILAYAQKNNYRKICLTDHFWDETIPYEHGWYCQQDFAHIAAALPLPQAQGVQFCFGCEAEMDENDRLGISLDRIDSFDFVIIPTTHLHMMIREDAPIDERAVAYIRRLHRLLEMDLPFSKIGIAHLTCHCIARGWEPHLQVLDRITDAQFAEAFAQIAKVGAGVELNLRFFKYTEEDKARVMRPFQIAKDAGCKFYFGSDAHHPNALATAPAEFQAIADYLALDESDRFDF